MDRLDTESKIMILIAIIKCLFNKMKAHRIQLKHWDQKIMKVDLLAIMQHQYLKCSYKGHQQIIISPIIITYHHSHLQNNNNIKYLQFHKDN